MCSRRKIKCVPKPGTINRLEILKNSSEEEQKYALVLLTLEIFYPDIVSIEILHKKMHEITPILINPNHLVSLVERLVKTKHIVRIGEKYRIWANGMTVLDEGSWKNIPLYVEKTYTVPCPKCKGTDTNYRETTDDRLLAASCNTCKGKDGLNLKWKHRI